MWRRTKQGKESVRRDHLHREQSPVSSQRVIGFNVIVWARTRFTYFDL